MYLELKKKIRNYKATDEFKSELPDTIEISSKYLCNYDVSLKENTYPFLSSYVDMTKISDYEIDGFDSNPSNLIKSEDVFEKECYGPRGIISNIIKAEHVDSDWMTGVFLAQEIIPIISSGQFESTINTWHNGCQSGLLRGLHHFCQSSKYCGRKKISWNWKGVDLRPDHLPTLIGAMGNGNICIGSNLVSLENKIKEEWKEGADILFHDIYPLSETILLSGMISALTFLNNRGHSVLRLPEPHLWKTNTTNVILTMCMVFKTVNIWSPPWGRRNGQKKYYIIAYKKKKTIFKNNYRGLVKILNKCETSQFLKKNIHDDDEIKEWIEILQNKKNEIISDHTESVTTDEWISIIMNNLLELSQKI